MILAGIILNEITITIFLMIWFFTEHLTVVNYIKRKQHEIKNPYFALLLANALCFKCVTFWTLLLITGGSVVTALAFAFIAGIYMKLGSNKDVMIKEEDIQIK